MPELPSKDTIAHELRGVRDFLRRNRLEETDVRLQVLDNGDWAVHSGDASYDTDHRGSWGAAGVQSTDTDADLTATAEDLLAQVADSVAQEETLHG